MRAVDAARAKRATMLLMRAWGSDFTPGTIPNSALPQLDAAIEAGTVECVHPSGRVVLLNAMYECSLCDTRWRKNVDSPSPAGRIPIDTSTWDERYRDQWEEAVLLAMMESLGWEMSVCGYDDPEFVDFAWGCTMTRPGSYPFQYVEGNGDTRIEAIEDALLRAIEAV